MGHLLVVKFPSQLLRWAPFSVLYNRRDTDRTFFWQSHRDAEKDLRRNITSATSVYDIGKDKKSKPQKNETDSVHTLSDEDDNFSHRKVSRSGVSNSYLDRRCKTSSF
jgi:hypothetical protein